MEFNQLPMPYDINIYQGDTVFIPFVLKKDFALVELTDYTISAQIVLDQSTVDFTVINLDQTNFKGQFTASLTDTQTTALSGYYDWFMSYSKGTEPNIEIKTIVKGRLHVAF